MTRTATDHGAGAFSWRTTAQNTYDSTYHRLTSTTNGNGNTTRTTYTVDSAYLTTGQSVAQPTVSGVTHTTSETYDPERGLTLTSTDADHVVTTTHYDALGRTTSVWKNSRATSSLANETYTYTLSNTSVSGVVTNALNDNSGYLTSATIDDSLGRTRQTQAYTPQGGRLIDDTLYDSRGWTGQAEQRLLGLRHHTHPVAEGGGRQSGRRPGCVHLRRARSAGLRHLREERSIVSTTTTVYNGDATTVIPPTGGVTKTTRTDALGRDSELDEYSAAPTLVTPLNTTTGVFYLTGGTTNATTYGYDALDRKTGRYAAATTDQAAYTSTSSPGNQTASWVYDNANTAVAGMTYPVGHVTTATSYSGGYAYLQQAVGFNVFGESLGEETIVPSAAQGSVLGKTWKITHSYTSANDQVAQVQLGSSTSYATVTDAYDSHTGDLTDQLVTRSTATPSSVDETAYTYDLSGNITHQTETRNGSSATAETQCYAYDTLDWLTTAWTATDNCAATPTSSDHSTVGDGITGGAYWTSWTFDAVGNRLTQTQHPVAGAGSDTVTTSGFSSVQSNTLTATTTNGGTTGSTSYGYDSDGNTDATAGTSTSYIYDADGNLLLQTDPTTTTLYLGSEQITLDNAAGPATGVRYYTARRSHHRPPRNRHRLRLRTRSRPAQHQQPLPRQHPQTPTWRQFDPYGNPRGTTASWPDNRTFLDKTTDTTTGLTDVGAREYDPTLGRFTSLDPVFEDDSPQELGGYAYASDNPVTFSDPTGQEIGSRPNSCQYDLANCSKKVQKEVGYDPKTCLADYRRGTVVSKGTAAAISNHYSNPVTDSGYTPPAPKPQPHRSWWSKSWSWTKQTFGTWDGWKNRVLPALTFRACLVVSAGACVVVGVAAATVAYGGDWAQTGKWTGVDMERRSPGRWEVVWWRAAWRGDWAPAHGERRSRAMRLNEPRSRFPCTGRSWVQGPESAVAARAM